MPSWFEYQEPTAEQIKVWLKTQAEADAIGLHDDPSIFGCDPEIREEDIELMMSFEEV